MKHIVGFSGGIDSQACALWVRERFPPEDVLLVNSSAGGFENAITTAFIHLYSETVFPVTIIDAIVGDAIKRDVTAAKRGLDRSSLLDFEGLIRLKGRPPSIKARFCTSILKLEPQKRWIEEHFGPSGQFAGEDYARYTGVRRDESDSRKDTPLVEWDKWFDCELHAPLAYWTKQKCFDYVRAAGEPINPLYRLGAKRVGCKLCVNSSKDDIANTADRFPEVIDEIRGIEQRTRRTFFPPIVPGKAINWIDEVVVWSRTVRGGRQFPMFQPERQSCESRYGLCE